MVSRIENSATAWKDARQNWPDPILLKDVEQLPGFPYKKRYLRNLCTGSKADKYLKPNTFYIGRFPAIRRDVLIAWLENRTG